MSHKYFDGHKDAVSEWNDDGAKLRETYRDPEEKRQRKQNQKMSIKAIFD